MEPAASPPDLVGGVTLLHDWYYAEMEAHRAHHTLSRWLCCMFIFELWNEAGSELRRASASEDPAARAG